jgi:hypothetical protein
MFRWMLIAAALLAAASAGAAERTLIRDYTSRNCSTNQETPIYAAPDVKAKAVLKADEQTAVHVIGGKQFGPPVDYPHTDSEWARTWLHLRLAGRKYGWAPASVINCGG